MGNMKNYKLYIFDLDGTLLDTRKDLTTAVNTMREAFGLSPLDIDTVIGMVGDGIVKLIERALKEINGVDLKEAKRVFDEAYSKILTDNTKPYDGVIEVLEKLKSKNKKLTVLTNKPRIYTLPIIERLNLHRYFDKILCADDLKNKKPDPEGINRLIDSLKVERFKAIMIGDSKNDVLSAKNAGIDSVFVKYGYRSIESVIDLNPDYVVDRPEDILLIESF